MTDKQKLLDQIALVTSLSAMCRNVSKDAGTLERQQEMRAMAAILEMHREKLEDIYNAMK